MGSPRLDTFEETASEGRPQMYGGDDHMDWDGSGWWVMLLAMGMFWFGVLAVAVWGIATFSRRERNDRHDDTALDIARRRYARGDITSEEFERLKRDL